MQPEEINKESETTGFSEEINQANQTQKSEKEVEPPDFGFLSEDESSVYSFFENKYARLGIAAILGALLIGTGYVIMTFYVPDPPKKTIRSTSNNLKSGNPFKNHDKRATAVAFSPDGKLMATGSVDTTIQFYKYTESNKPFMTLTGHKNAVNSIAFSPDGKLFASGSDDGDVKLWSVETGKEIATLSHRGIVAKQLADIPNANVKSVAFSPDGKIFASGGDDGHIIFWNTETKQTERIIDFVYMIWAISFSPDGKTIAAAGEGWSVSLWNTENGNLLFKIEDSELNTSLYSVAFSPDGAIIAVGAQSGKVTFWNRQNGERVWGSTELKPNEMSYHKDAVISLVFSSKNKLMASGSFDGTTKLWDVDRGAVMNTIRLMEAEGLYRIYSLAFAPNGTDLAIGDAKGEVLVYEIKDEFK